MRTLVLIATMTFSLGVIAEDTRLLTPEERVDGIRKADKAQREKWKGWTCEYRKGERHIVEVPASCGTDTVYVQVCFARIRCTARGFLPEEKASAMCATIARNTCPPAKECMASSDFYVLSDDSVRTLSPRPRSSYSSLGVPMPFVHSGGE